MTSGHSPLPAPHVWPACPAGRTPPPSQDGQSPASPAHQTHLPPPRHPHRPAGPSWETGGLHHHAQHLKIKLKITSLPYKEVLNENFLIRKKTHPSKERASGLKKKRRKSCLTYHLVSWWWEDLTTHPLHHFHSCRTHPSASFASCGQSGPWFGCAHFAHWNQW